MRPIVAPSSLTNTPPASPALFALGRSSCSRIDSHRAFGLNADVRATSGPLRRYDNLAPAGTYRLGRGFFVSALCRLTPSKRFPVRKPSLPNRQSPSSAGSAHHARHDTKQSRSVVMPTPAVIAAMPVKGIVNPTRVRTVCRPPKRPSPHGADHTTDDRAWRPSDDKSSSSAKSCADGVCPRTGGRHRR